MTSLGVWPTAGAGEPKYSRPLRLRWIARSTSLPMRSAVGFTLLRPGSGRGVRRALGARRARRRRCRRHAFAGPLRADAFEQRFDPLEPRFDAADPLGD